MSIVHSFAGLITLAQIAAPGAPTGALISPAAAGNVDTGDHSYKVTFLSGATETEGGTQSDPVTVADKAVNGKVVLTGIPISTDSTVSSRKIYRTIAGADPDVAANYLLLTTIANNTATTFTDNIADGSLGAAAPTTNNTVADDFPQTICDTLAAEGMTNPRALSFLQIAEAGAGNLVISTNSSIGAETEGYPIGDSTNPLILTVSGAGSDVIQSGELYLFSATAGKQAFIIARSKF